MHIVERQMVELRSSESISCFSYAQQPSIAAALVMASQSAFAMPNNVNISAPVFQTPSSLQQTRHFSAAEVVDVEIYQLMNSIYGDLLSSQHELDEVEANALYGNLWDMYE